MSFYLKDPRSRVDYGIDWAGRAAGATIVASAWSVIPAEEGGVAVETFGFGGVSSEVRFSGGIAGHSYRLANLISWSDGRADTQSLTLRVEET